MTSSDQSECIISCQLNHAMQKFVDDICREVALKIMIRINAFKSLLKPPSSDLPLTDRYERPKTEQD